MTPGAETLPVNPFWEFSVRIYSRPEVAEACLALQEKFKLDVNILLFCCWQAEKGLAPLTDADIAKIMTVSQDWHRQIVAGLRAVRQNLKGGFPPASPVMAEMIRKQIINLEIQSEQVEQDLIFQTIPGKAGNSDQAGILTGAQNCKTYLSHLGKHPDDEDAARFGIILAAIFPDNGTADVAGILKTSTLDRF